MTGEESKSDDGPLVSVLMPCYNHEAYVISSLESVAASDYKLIEFIFIDDASQDNSFNLAAKWIENNQNRFVRTVYKRHEKNLGICTTMNELYALSHGVYINYLASDDNLLAEGLSKQVSFAVKNGVDFVFTDLTLIDEAGALISDSALQYFGKNGQKLRSSKACLIVDVIFKWNLPWNKSFMSAALVNKIGLFDESLCFEDRDFAISALVNGSFALLVDATTAYRFRVKSKLTPGLLLEELTSDFRKADCRNYLHSSGITRLLLGILVYSYKERYRDLGIQNPWFIRFATRMAGWLKRLVFKVDGALIW
jgi:glycosyltransferase involved in cell wall biosynthesis